MLNQIKQLVWFSPNNLSYYVRWCRFVSSYEIGETNKYGHILVAIIHYFPNKKPFCGSFTDFSKYIDDTSLSSLVYARYYYLKRTFKLSLSSKLELLAWKLRK